VVSERKASRSIPAPGDFSLRSWGSTVQRHRLDQQCGIMQLYQDQSYSCGSGDPIYKINTVSVEVPCGVSCAVSCDPNRFRQYRQKLLLFP
jgi:hypothetical protein